MARGSGAYGYNAARAERAACARGRRGARKLAAGTEQISGRLWRMHPDEPAARVSHETIYCALYAMPRGELRAELIKMHDTGADAALAALTGRLRYVELVSKLATAL